VTQPEIPPPPPREAWRQVRPPRPSGGSAIGALALVVGSGLLLISLALPRLVLVQPPDFRLTVRGSGLLSAIMLVLGLFELVLAAAALRGASPGGASGVIAFVLVLLVALQWMDMLRIADTFRSIGYEVSVEPGAVLSLFAGAVLGAGGLLQWTRSVRR
jgi:hypothetical protein